MICNSGLLITRKLKELVTGGDFSPSKRSPPVKVVNLKPISAEPGHVYNNSVRPGPGLRVAQGRDPRPGHPSAVGYCRGVDMMDSWDACTEAFESPSLVCGTLSKAQLREEPRYTSLCRPAKTQPEFTKINGKTVRLYSSLPRATLSRLKTGHFSPSTPQEAQTASRDPLPPQPPDKLDVAANDAVAPSDLYTELPRKKKKPCMAQGCTSVHHRHDHTSSSCSTNSKSSTNDNQTKKFSTLEHSRKKPEKSKVLQKFHSLDRGWKSFISPKTSSCKNSRISLSNDIDDQINKRIPKVGTRGPELTIPSASTTRESVRVTGVQPSSDRPRQGPNPASSHTGGERLRATLRRPTLPEPDVHQPHGGKWKSKSPRERKWNTAGDDRTKEGVISEMDEEESSGGRQEGGSGAGYQCHTLPKARE